MNFSEECPKAAINEIKLILSTIDINPHSIQKIIDCFSSNKFLICSFYHQTCVINRLNNQIKPSPPCKEVIDNMEKHPACKISFKFTEKMYRLNKLCPGFLAGERMNFTAYPRKDIQNLEQCQMNHNGWFSCIFLE